jgi:hypothetical protein
MSEELKNEAPKRKRRTREEMEAARAAGLEPAKRVRKTSKKKEAEIEKSPDEFVAKPKLTAEQKVMLMACLNPIVSSAAINAAKENGVEVVILEDRVIHDYLSTKGKKEEGISVADFLNNTSNRLHAEDQCVKLWMILTGGKPIEEVDDVVFTRTEVVRKTNLTHKKAEQVLQLLRAFGMLEYTKGIHEFKLHFNPKRQHQTIQTEIISMCQAMNNDILRFKASIESDKKMTEKEKSEIYEAFRNTIEESIKF